jgi:hypothetical protein
MTAARRPAPKELVGTAEPDILSILSSRRCEPTQEPDDCSRRSYISLFEIGIGKHPICESLLGLHHIEKLTRWNIEVFNAPRMSQSVTYFD